MDPLSSFGYSYPHYDQIPNMYGYDVKVEHCNQKINALTNLPPQQYIETYPNHQHFKPSEEPNFENQADLNVPQNEPEEIDTKEGIPLLPEHRKKTPKKKGKTSNYWNKKIDDKDFPFYGCTICNVSFQTIQSLDEHVTIHKGRITSYDIRVRNKIKRKEKIRQMKKNKKLGKAGKTVKGPVKKEMEIAVEIKPEDGYIGNDKATDYNKSEPNPRIDESKPNEETNTTEPKPNIPSEPKVPEDDSGSPIDKKTEIPELENDSSVKSIDKKTEPELENDSSVKSIDEKCKPETVEDSSLKSIDKKSKIPEPEDPRLLKLFKCFACQKQFSLSYYLRLHVRSHTDEKPYTCAECGQSFITASKLGRHTKRIHLAIRFQCRICYRFFSRFDALTRHFDKVHSADKIEGEPYDFNAILPYLKELEEQLKEQSDKTKPESVWGDAVVKTDTADTAMKDEFKPLVKLDNLENNDIKIDFEQNFEIDTKENIVDDNLITVSSSNGEHAYVTEDKDVPFEEVKVEPEIDYDHPAGSPPAGNYSDDDYFPSNTWLAPPSPGSPPVVREAPSRGRGRPKKQFPTQCELCDKVINSNSYYKIHLRTHSGEKPFKCYVCGRGFITSSKMHRHILTHHDWEGDKESELKVKEENQPEIKREEEVEKSGVEGKKKKTKKVPKVKKEKDVVKFRKYRKRPHACIYCQKRFLHLETLQVHKKTHDGQTVLLKCNFCLEVMPDEETLTAHESTHSGPRPYLCTICNRCYTKKETMIYHRKNHGDGSTGSDRREFICDICSKSFNAQCKLQRHIVSHKVEKFILRYECPVCAHMFHTKYHIKMHLTTHQKEGLILEENRNEILAMVLQNARKIPRKADSSASVADIVPRDERSRVCNICGQVFQHFYYLEEHLKSHGSRIAIEDESKPEDNKHICPICNKGFKLHYYLKLHSFTHSKERPFICQQCGKGFITKGKLKRHLETHTGLKKYQCHICCKYFTRPSYLRIHVRTIHGTQDYNFVLNTQNYVEQSGV